MLNEIIEEQLESIEASALEQLTKQSENWKWTGIMSSDDQCSIPSALGPLNIRPLLEPYKPPIAERRFKEYSIYLFDPKSFWREVKGIKLSYCYLSPETL